MSIDLRIPASEVNLEGHLKGLGHVLGHEGVAGLRQLDHFFVQEVQLLLPFGPTYMVLFWRMALRSLLIFPISLIYLWATAATWHRDGPPKTCPGPASDRRSTKPFQPASASITSW